MGVDTGIEEETVLSVRVESVEMPSFHSNLQAPGDRAFGNVAIMPLRQTTTGSARGPALEIKEEDIVDETLDLFKANILFKNYEMKDSVDRVLVYVTLYAVECLKRLAKCSNKERAIQDMYSMALEPFAIPGDSGFPLNAFYLKPKKAEAEEMKKYFIQLRHETGARLAEKVFDPEMSSEGSPNKWWTCWAKRKFLN